MPRNPNPIMAVIDSPDFKAMIRNADLVWGVEVSDPMSPEDAVHWPIWGTLQFKVARKGEALRQNVAFVSIDPVTDDVQAIKDAIWKIKGPEAIGVGGGDVVEVVDCYANALRRSQGGEPEYPRLDLDRPHRPGAKCSRCGGTVEVEAPAFMGTAPTVFAICPSCSDAEHLAAGGLVSAVAGPIEGALFEPGPLRVTPGAAATLADSRQHSAEFLARHARGDWGHVDEADVEDDDDEDDDEPLTSALNAETLASGRGQVMGAYRTAKGVELWMITRLEEGNQTTLLLPDEY